MAIQEESRTPSETPDVSQVRHPEVSHETADVNVRGVLIFIVVLIVVVAVLCVGLWWLLKAMSPRRDVPRRAVEVGRPLPPPPRLLGAPGAVGDAEDMKELRRAEEALLGSYGWIDPQEGVVRIPIRRAMELLLQRGLPVRSRAEAEAESPPEAQAPWEYVPSETSSGQTLRRRDP